MYMITVVTIGFQTTNILILEDIGQVMVCVELMTPPVLLQRDVVVVVQTVDDTAMRKYIWLETLTCGSFMHKM